MPMYRDDVLDVVPDRNTVLFPKPTQFDFVIVENDAFSYDTGPTHTRDVDFPNEPKGPHTFPASL